MTFRISPLEDTDIDTVCGGISSDFITDTGDVTSFLGRKMISMNMAQRAVSAVDRNNATAWAKGALMEQAGRMQGEASKMMAAAANLVQVSSIASIGGGKEISGLKQARS